MYGGKPKLPGLPGATACWLMMREQGCWHQLAFSISLLALKESPPKEDHHDKTDSAKGAILPIIVNIRAMPWSRATRTCFRSSSQFIRTAALRYFLLSSRSLPDISPIRSRLSPRYKRSSMFFVITLVTSFNSSLSLSRFCDARLS